jgi:hypothetical protein
MWIPDNKHFQSAKRTITVNAASVFACGNMSIGNGASFNGFVPFPASNAWNTNIASAHSIQIQPPS